MGEAEMIARMRAADQPFRFEAVFPDATWDDCETFYKLKFRGFVGESGVAKSKNLYRVRS